MSTYICDDGTYKYETVISVRVRYNINPNRGDSPNSMAVRIAHSITNHLTNAEELNTPNLGQEVVYDGRNLTKITMANAEVECWDHASQRGQRSNIHKLGYYTTKSELVNVWNRELRIVPKKDYLGMCSFDTNENIHPSDDVICLPTLPHGLLGDELVENIYDVSKNINTVRNEYIRKTATNLIEGLFEDGVPMPSDDDNTKSKVRTYRDLVNSALQSEEPEPF
jgi:hypothetical protein